MLVMRSCFRLFGPWVDLKDDSLMQSFRNRIKETDNWIYLEMCGRLYSQTASEKDLGKIPPRQMNSQMETCSVFFLRLLSTPSCLRRASSQVHSPSLHLFSRQRTQGGDTLHWEEDERRNVVRKPQTSQGLFFSPVIRTKKDSSNMEAGPQPHGERPGNDEGRIMRH